MPIKEFRIDRVLEGFKMTMSEFIDLCILLGCDYCDKIKGIGPKNAIKLIQEHKNIENILNQLDKKKNSVKDDWNYKKARELFHKPEVISAENIDLKWDAPDEEKIIEYMVHKNGFSEDRIRSGVQKLMKARKRTNQGRLDAFFKPSTVKPNINDNNNNNKEIMDSKDSHKRKPEDTDKSATNNGQNETSQKKKLFSIFTKPSRDSSCTNTRSKRKKK
jgi:flap endonuclease-1